MTSATPLARPLAALTMTVLVVLLPSLAILGQIFLPLHGLYDQFDYVIGRDFSNFWLTGKLALAGRAGEIYDLNVYLAAMRVEFLPTQPMMNFSYPPYAIPVLLPLGMLPYPVALALWLGVSLVAFYAAVAGAGGRETHWKWALFLAPATLFAISIAQATLIFAFLFVAGLRWAGTRPILAGVLLGLLAIKPHFGLLVAPFLVLERRWRCIGAAVATVGVQCAVSLALFGAGPWHDYIGNTLPYQRMHLETVYGFIWVLLVSPYAWFRTVGLPLQFAVLLHGLVALGVGIGSLWWALIAARRDRELAIAILAVGAVLVTPYSVMYDLVIPLAAILPVVASRRDGLPRATVVALALFVGFPVVQIWLNLSKIDLAMPIMLLALSGLVRLVSVADAADAKALAWRRLSTITGWSKPQTVSTSGVI